MGKKQKFQRGNLVEVLFGHAMWSVENGKTTLEDVAPEEVGKKAIIKGSYRDLYGGEDNTDSYSVVFLDTGNTVAWKDDNQLKLIDKGGEHLFEEAKKNRDRINKQNTDIKYILSLLDEGNLSSESILFLFNMLGVDSAFNRNGEFYVLTQDWAWYHPVFKHIKNAKTLKEAKSVFTPAGQASLNIKKVFDKFKEVV